MKRIVLSDHPTAMADAHARERVARHQAGLEEHARAVEQRRLRKEHLARKADEALNNVHILTFLGTTLCRLGLYLSADPVKPDLEPPSADEQRWRAGADAEEYLQAAIHAALDDQWTMVCGYRNGSGEADIVLVGLAGILAIEAKYKKGPICAYGDHWLRVVYDNYGNRVGNEDIVDRGGRSPSQQVNAVADDLERFLKSRNAPTDIVYRVVAVPHPDAAYGEFEDLTVDDVMIGLPDPEQVKHVASRMGGRLDGAACERVVKLIVKDHEHHRQRRLARQAKPQDA